jgi:hypothetical protein
MLVPTGVFVQDLREPSITLLSDPETLQSDVPLPGSHDVLMAEAEDDRRLDFIGYILEKSVKTRSRVRKLLGATPTTSSSATGGLPPMLC